MRVERAVAVTCGSTDIRLGHLKPRHTLPLQQGKFLDRQAILSPKTCSQRVLALMHLENTAALNLAGTCLMCTHYFRAFPRTTLILAVGKIVSASLPFFGASHNLSDPTRAKPSTKPAATRGSLASILRLVKYKVKTPLDAGFSRRNLL
jgi:hypothetical protein